MLVQRSKCKVHYPRMRIIHIAYAREMDAVAGPSRRIRTRSGMELPPQSSSSSSTPIRPRKRLRKPDLWKRNLAKTKRPKGEAYVSQGTGQEVEAAKPGAPCSCKKQCFSKFTEEERKKIFSCFWGLGDKSVQDAYLHGLIRVRKVARRRPRTAQSSRSPRENSFVYVVRFQ